MERISVNKEQWLDIVGWEGFYQISDMGRLRSLQRPFVPQDRILKACLDSDGYLFAGLFKNGKRLACPKIHRLVLEAFVGLRPSGMEGRHKDGNKLNNRLDNIEWATHEVNELDKSEHGTVLCGSKIGTSKLTENEVSEIRMLWATSRFTYNQSVLARMFKVGQFCIWSIIHRKTWKHI